MRKRPRRVVIGIALLVAFVIGIAVGEAIDDGKTPGGSQTLSRTLRPLPLAPARETVTVTTQNP